jgi:L-threonylcarbamoyladenylate synthase
METVLLESQQIGEAAGVLRGGGLLVFPTETVYGLGASAWDASACRGIFAAKGRPADNPLIVHIASTAMLSEVAAEVPEAARRLFESFAPGPLTVILRRGPRIPDIVTAGLDTVGVRIPAHPVAQALLRAVGMPVAAPSANRSGRPSPTDFGTAVVEMGGRADAVIDGGPCDHGLESTIVRVAAESVTVLREGAVTREMIREALPGFEIRGLQAGGETAAAGPAAAPGTRHTHYKPRAQLVLAAREAVPAAVRRHAASRTAYIGCTPLLGAYTTMPAVSVQVAGLEDYGRRLYRSFYLFDREGCEVIIAELPAEAGIGRALRDRLTRAAG